MEQRIIDLLKNSTQKEVTSIVPVFMTAEELSNAVASLNNAMYYGKVSVTGKDASYVGAATHLVFALQGKIVFAANISVTPINAQTESPIIFDEVYLSNGLGARVANPVIINTTELLDSQTGYFDVEIGMLDTYFATQTVLQGEESGISYSEQFPSAGGYSRRVENGFIKFDIGVLPAIGAYFITAPASLRGFVSHNTVFNLANVGRFGTVTIEAANPNYAFRWYFETLSGIQISEIFAPEKNCILPLDEINGHYSWNGKMRLKTNKAGGSFLVDYYKNGVIAKSETVPVSSTGLVELSGYGNVDGASGNTFINLSHVVESPSSNQREVYYYVNNHTGDFNGVSFEAFGDTKMVPINTTSANVLTVNGYATGVRFELVLLDADGLGVRSIVATNGQPFYLSAINDFVSIQINDPA